MMQSDRKGEEVHSLSDTDCQMFSKTYRLACELYYENRQGREPVQDLLHLTRIIPQIVENRQQSNAMTILSQMEILRAKAKGEEPLRNSIDRAIEHLRRPTRERLQGPLVVELLRKNQLFPTGCMIATLLFADIAETSNAKDMLESIASNITVNIPLAVELLLLLCSNEHNCQLAVKEGIVKSIFLHCIPATKKDVLSLHKTLKLLKVLTATEPSLLRDREKVLAEVIYKRYAQATVADICAKCYEPQYCAQIEQQLHPKNIDQLYLWSFVPAYCKDLLGQTFIDSLMDTLKEKTLPVDMEGKGYGIVANYCEYCEHLRKDFFKAMPKYYEGLQSYLKICLAMSRQDPNGVKLIDWPSLQSFAYLCPFRVEDMIKELKEMIGRSVQVGTLDHSLKSIFSADRNTALLGERVGRVPKNNAELEATRHLLREQLRPGASEFEKDNLLMMKEKAVESLHTAVKRGYRLNLNPLVSEWHCGNVELLSKFLQAVELNLVMNEEAAESADAEKVLQLIRWMEENYNGEVVDWGGIVEILAILFEDNEWLKHLPLLPKDSFWMLQVGELTNKSEKTLFSCLDSLKSATTRQLSMIVGFLGKTLSNEHKLKLMASHGFIFDRIREEMGKGANYKLHLMMLSYFLRGWHSESEEESPTFAQDNAKFEKLISPFLDQAIAAYRALPQEHCFLQSCLPFKIQTHSLTKNTSQLANSHGKLAAYLNENSGKSKAPLPPDRFASICTLPPPVLLQNLKFLAQNPSLLNVSELQKLLERITKHKDSFWELYPHYLNIVSLLIELIDAESDAQAHHLTDNIVALIEEVEGNESIQGEEKEDLLYDMCDTLESLKGKGSYIEIERVRKTVIRITEEKVREEIIYILDNYQIKQQPPPPPPPPAAKENKPAQPPKPEPKKEKVQAASVESELRMEANLQNFVDSSVVVDVPKPLVTESLEQQFQSVKYQSVKPTLFDALEMLKKIVQKKEPPSKFNALYPILSASAPTEPEKELMGTLLAKYYDMETDQRALTLLLDKERTDLGKELFEELVRKHLHAFKLVRRWRFESREALDIAALRMKEIYLDDACVVAAYNLKKAAELEYFYSRKHHLGVAEVLCRVVSEDEVVHFLTLVGTVVKLPQIKQEFIAQHVHTKIMPLNTMFPMSARVNSSLSYALSTLSFEEPAACAQIVAQTEPLAIIYSCLRSESTNKQLVEPGACLIANLSYPNAELKEILRQRKTVALLLLLFEANLASTDSSTYKQLLRSMGNLSMNRQCTEELIEGQFCSLAVRMAEKLDFFVYYEEKKARLMKLLINLVSNLASHKSRLEVMHAQKVTLLVVTMLETTEKNSDLLAGCIDTVDALCQSAEIELYLLGEKRLPYILMDVFKLQEEVAILLKAGRLLSNLAIHAQSVPFLLRTSLLSVVGNVVVPNLYVGCMGAEEAKRMEGYVVKVLGRIHQCKPPLELVLKSGYLDCLVRTIELFEVEDSYLEMLFFYSSHLPNFLNKRAFSCLVKVLTRKVDSKAMVGKCIVSFKNLLTFSYNREDEDEVLEDVPRMYQQILKSEFLVDGLFLLVYHLLRSHNLRRLLRRKEEPVTEAIRALAKEELYLEISRSLLFLVHNPATPLSFATLPAPQEEEQFYRVLKSGFQCRLYRGDGSHKRARVDIDEEYNVRLYKYPDGEVKAKYVLNINHIRDLQVDFREKEELWSHSVFALEQSFLETHVPDRALCMTLVGSSRWGEVKLLNFEFAKEEEKEFFYQCVSHLICLFRT